MQWAAANTALRSQAAKHGIGAQAETVAEPAPAARSFVRDFPELVNRPPVPIDNITDSTAEKISALLQVIRVKLRQYDARLDTGDLSISNAATENRSLRENCRLVVLCNS